MGVVPVDNPQLLLQMLEEVFLEGDRGARYEPTSSNRQGSSSFENYVFLVVFVVFKFHFVVVAQKKNKEEEEEEEEEGPTRSITTLP